MIRTILALTAKRCPWGLVGMLGLVLAVEGFVASRSMDLFDCDEWAFRRAGRVAASPAVKDAGILCFGDSLVKLGVIPSVIRERTGRPTYNLALSGSQAPTSYFMLKRALEAGARPEAIVVDFNPPLLRVGPRHITTRSAALLGPVEAARLARWADDPALFGEVALGGLLPTLRGKSSIRANIRDALAGRASANPQWNGQALRNWARNDGAQLMVGDQAARKLTPLDVSNLQVGFYPEWSCHRANVEGIDRFLALAAEHRVRVFWLLVPMLPGFHDAISVSGIDAQHMAFVRSWQAKYPGLVVFDGRRKVTEIESFWDAQHLSVEGASAYSRVLGDALRRSIGGAVDARWVALPEARRGPLPPGVEDMEQSRLAVERQNAATLRR